MHYHELPRLLFFKHRNASIDLDLFKKKLFEQIESEFEIELKDIQYGTVQHQAADRDNSFVERYVREVYFHFLLKNGNLFVLHFYNEESPSASFEEILSYDFHSFSFYFEKNTTWSWINHCWDKMKTFMSTQPLYDATLSFSYGTGLYQHFTTIKDEEGKSFIAALSMEEELKTIRKAEYSYIEIQYKPYVSINELLAAHPEKSAVTSIQINNNELSEWPAALFEFTKLEKIDLYNNQIKLSDQRLSVFETIRSINLHNNPIEKDQKEIDLVKSFLPNNCEVVYQPNSNKNTWSV